MYTSECRTYPTQERGCATHGRPECLCDVQPLEAGVPIRAIPNAARLLELGVSCASFVTWAEEIHAWQETEGLELVAEA